MAGLLSWKKKYHEVKFEGVQRGFCRGGRGRSFEVERPKTEKALEPTCHMWTHLQECLDVSCIGSWAFSAFIGKNLMTGVSLDLIGTVANW